MKKHIVLLLLSVVSLISFAQNNGVTMEGFSQGWLDYEATIHLKNNTKENSAYKGHGGKTCDIREPGSIVEVTG